MKKNGAAEHGGSEAEISPKTKQIVLKFAIIG
jgi:hypothetical protein